jgi:hypothetical protein
MRQRLKDGPKEDFWMAVDWADALGRATGTGYWRTWDLLGPTMRSLLYCLYIWPQEVSHNVGFSMCVGWCGLS